MFAPLGREAALGELAVRLDGFEDLALREEQVGVGLADVVALLASELGNQAFEDVEAFLHPVFGDQQARELKAGLGVPEAERVDLGERGLGPFRVAEPALDEAEPVAGGLEVVALQGGEVGGELEACDRVGASVDELFESPPREFSCLRRREGHAQEADGERQRQG
ncbi:hypothetical protein D3C86_947840 [compost metagenome]